MARFHLTFTIQYRPLESLMVLPGKVDKDFQLATLFNIQQIVVPPSSPIPPADNATYRFQRYHILRISNNVLIIEVWVKLGKAHAIQK